MTPIGRPFPVGDLNFVPAFAPDGRLTGNGPIFSQATSWDLDPDSWQESACLLAGRNLTRAWADYVGPDEPYRSTCDGWPPGH